MKSRFNTTQAIVQELLNECKVSKKELLQAIESYQSTNTNYSGGTHHGV